MKSIYGGAIKNVSQDGYEMRVRGLGVVFDTEDGERDLALEYFTKDTFLGWKKGDYAIAKFNHGHPIIPDWMKGWVPDNVWRMSNQLSLMKFTNPVRTSLEEEGLGVVAEIILDRRKEYEDFVAGLIGGEREKSVLGWSSGAMQDAEVDEISGEITHWVIGEFSFTPTPAEPRAKIREVKSVLRGTNDEAIVKRVRNIFECDVSMDKDVGDVDIDLEWERMRIARAKYYRNRARQIFQP